jgi:putative MATE family efflux protein
LEETIEFKRSGILLKKKFFSYLFPTVMMNVALSLGMIVDGIIVGNLLGTEAFSAVNICAPLIYFFNAMYALHGVGGSTLVAHSKGKMEHALANRLYTLSLMGLLATSVLVALIGFFASGSIAHAISGGSVLEPLVYDYFRLQIMGAPLLVVVPGMVYFIRTDSRPQFAANILIIANVVNLCCDMIYMGVFNMGISGAALATLTGYLVGGLVSLHYFLSKSKTLYLVSVKEDLFKNYKSILSTGVPSALFGITGFIKNFSVNTIVLATLGPNGVAMFGVCLNTLSLSSIVIGGTSQTVIPVIGCVYGEKDYKGIQTVIKTALKTVGGLCSVILLILLLFPAQIASLFGITDPDILVSINSAIRTFAFSLPFFGINFLMVSYFQTIKRRLFSSTITVMENIIILLPLMLLFENAFGEMGIWISFVTAEVTTLAYILVMAKIIQRKSQPRPDSILLLQKTEGEILDVTIHNKMEEAVGLSQVIIDFCLKNGLAKNKASHAGLIAEELATNIISYGFKDQTTHFMDIRLNILPESLILRIRDDGMPFNPVAYIEKEAVEESLGLELVKKMSDDFEYSYVLNFNNVMVEIGL